LFEEKSRRSLLRCSFYYKNAKNTKEDTFAIFAIFLFEEKSRRMAQERIYLEADDPSESLLIEGGIIKRIGGTAPEGSSRLDCRGAKIRPGFVNAHTHLYSGLAPLGMPAPEPPPQNFLQILERVWWRLDRALDESSLRAAARFYIAEALLHGTTALIDHHESPNFIEGSLDILADACHELGLRALLCYGATERNGGKEEAERGLAECRRFLSENRRPLVRGLVGLHASFTVSDDTIQTAGALCRELDTVLHVHVAEDRADVDDAQKRGYSGPLERLMKLDGLVPGSILAHGVHLSPDQVGRTAGEGYWLVQNPRSNHGNRVGYPHALYASHRVALGTDGYPSDMVEEEGALLETARDQDGVEKLAAEKRLDAGTTVISERFHNVVGPLQEGAVSDLMVYESSASFVRHVLAGGNPVVKNGIIQTGDIDTIRDEAHCEAKKLWERMKTL
jgi:cytosine/adenosine deaminase-related metal-dependent hydrolase